MPLYEYRCRTCASTFEVRRPMSDANAPASCPDGHDGAIRMLSVFASTGAASASGASSASGGSSAMPTGGCGSGCGCHGG